MLLFHQEGELVDVLEGDASAAGNSLQRVFRDVYGQVRHLRDTLVETAEQCATTGNVNTILVDIYARFWRCAFQRALDGTLDFRNGVVECLRDFPVVDFHRDRKPLHEVTALHFVIFWRIVQVLDGRADFDLDTFGSGLSDGEVVLTAHVVDDVVVELVASDFAGTAGHDTS